MGMITGTALALAPTPSLTQNNDTTTYDLDVSGSFTTSIDEVPLPTIIYSSLTKNDRVIPSVAFIDQDNFIITYRFSASSGLPITQNIQFQYIVYGDGEEAGGNVVGTPPSTKGGITVFSDTTGLLIEQGVEPGNIYYLDSVNGDDGNDGATPYAAFQTLAPLAALTNIILVGVGKNGIVPANVTLPSVDCIFRNIIFEEGFITGTATYVLEKSCTVTTHDTPGIYVTSAGRVFNGALMQGAFEVIGSDPVNSMVKMDNGLYSEQGATFYLRSTVAHPFVNYYITGSGNIDFTAIASLSSVSGTQDAAFGIMKIDNTATDFGFNYFKNDYVVSGNTQTSGTNTLFDIDRDASLWFNIVDQSITLTGESTVWLFNLANAAQASFPNLNLTYPASPFTFLWGTTAVTAWAKISGTLNGTGGTSPTFPLADASNLGFINYSIVNCGASTSNYNNDSFVLTSGDAVTNETLYTLDGSGLTGFSSSVPMTIAASGTGQAMDISADTSISLTPGPTNQVQIGNAQLLTSLQVNVKDIEDVDYSVLITDYLIGYSTLTAARTITLPTAGNSGSIFIIKDQSGSASGANTLTIVVDGGGNIDGASSLVIDTAYGSATVYFNSTSSQWFTI